MSKPYLCVPFIALILATGSAATGAAQSCGDEVSRLAQQYNLSTDLPQSGSSEMPSAPATPESPSAATRTERLAQSGGELSPPDVGAPMAIQPPAKDSAPMATAPPLTPSSPGSADAGGLTAAQRSQMESLLQGARAAARQGKDEQCLERLREAAAIPGRRTAPQ